MAAETTDIMSTTVGLRFAASSENSSVTPSVFISTSYEASTDFMISSTASSSSSSEAPGTSSTFLAFDNTTFNENKSYLQNVTGLPVSAEEREQYLTYLQEQTTQAMIPAVTYLIILATVGLIGNSLVLFVYSRKFKQTSTRVFIMAIACFDIVTNVVAIPGEIYDMFNLWNFDQPFVCKTRLYVNAFTTMVAAMVLVAVAVVRYRKICKPFKKQVSIKMAKIISVILAIASLTFSIPYAIINGRQTKPTPRSDIQGFECTIDDYYVNTIWPSINSAFFIFLFVVCSIPLVVMYIMIGVTAWKHSKVYGVTSKSTSKGETYGCDSGTSNEPGTKSTEDSPLKITTTQKTRSFVKKKGEFIGGLTSSNGVTDNDNKNHAKDNNRQDDNDNGDDVIEYLDDSDLGTGSGKTNNNCSVKMIRSATGEKVHINMLMVRELTVKLRAVKKEAESRTAENDDSTEYCENMEKAKKAISTPDRVIENMQNKNRSTEKIDESDSKSQVDKINKEEANRLYKSKKQRNKSGDSGKVSTTSPSKRFSKSVGDLTRLTERENLGKELAKHKAAENEDIDFRTDIRGLIDRQEQVKTDETESSNDEPLSEFAKAMQWVDLTYCLQEDKENETANNEGNGDEIDSNSLAKKGSFALGRKISRDNSFLQRHRKLKDALTDTLTRARRSRKEREAMEAEAKENLGHATLENINSESENTGNNDDTDNAENEKEIKDTRTSSGYEVKVLKRKASRVKDMIKSESANRTRVHSQRAQRRGIGRTTAMLIIISAVYVFGFLPFLGLMFGKALSPETFSNLDLAPLALYNLFLRSYFLNSAANPIIYSLCDVNFRRECIGLIKCW